MPRSLSGLIVLIGLAAGGAAGQSDVTTVTLSLSGSGAAFGIPSQVAGRVPNLLLLAGNSTGTATQIPLGFAGIAGSKTGTDIVLVPAGNSGDLLHFHDSAPAESNTGRSGTASFDYGAGAFSGASGTLSYVFACTNGCFGGSGTPLAGTFNFSLTASGTLTLPTTVAQDVLPSIVPTLGDAYEGGGGVGSIAASGCYSIDQTGNGIDVVASDGGGGSSPGIYRHGPNPNGRIARDISTADGGGGIGLCPFDGGGGIGGGSYHCGPNPDGSIARDMSTADGGGGIGLCPSDGPGGSGSGIYRRGPNPNAVPRSTTTAPAASLSITPPWQPVPSTFSATATCPGLPTSCWMTIPAPTGNIAPFTNSPIGVDFNLGSLAAGVYPATISLTVTPSGGAGAASTENVPFTLIVGNGAPQLQLSETGIPFHAVTGAQQSHAIYLASSGNAIPYTATASTLTGGNWLSVTPASGSASSTVLSPLNIQANPAGLATGSYFGRVDISAPTAFKPVQSVEVVLTVGAAGAAPVPSTPVLSTAGVIFVTQQTKNPPPQSITVSTSSNAPVAVAGQASSDILPSWLTASPYSATLQPGQSLTETLTVDSRSLASGVYTGSFYEQATATGVSGTASVTLIVTPPPGTTCTPTRLVPVITNLGAGFELSAGLPVSVEAQVIDDCGSPLESGAVQASFSSGDAAVAMTPLGDGQWAGTWEPHRVAGGSVSIGIGAQSSSGLTGSTSTAGTLDANPTATVITPGGIVNAAGLVSGVPIAPGEFISIYGSNLASTVAASPSFPYQTILAGTQVFLGGQALPLEFVSPGLINAVVPFGTAMNGFEDLLVAQNGTYSLPETLVVAPVAPAVFTQSQSGRGAGAIVVLTPGGVVFEASANQPASAGDVVVIYCSGLGLVDPPVADGAAASLTTYSNTMNPVAVSIGGQFAQVLFAGLAPGYAGLYQINAVVPTGVSGGTNVPVVVTVAGVPSAPVTIPIQ